MSECCVKPGAKQVYTPTGKDVEIGGIKSYRVGSSAKRAVILFTDVFGYQFVNIREHADLVAKLDATVIVPNYLNDPLDPTKPIDFASFPQWLGRNPLDNAAVIGNKVVDALINEEKFESVIVQGFCYGAKVAINVAARDLDQVKVAVLNHPSFLSNEDAEKVKKPLLFLCAEKDGIFTPELRSKLSEILKSRNHPAEYIDYPGTEHGFSIRPDGTEVVTQARDKARKDAFEYIKKNF